MSVREGRREPAGLVEGVSANMSLSLRNWVDKTLGILQYDHGEDFARAVALEFDAGGIGGLSDAERVLRVCASDQGIFVEVIDMVLHFAATYHANELIGDLVDILGFGRSVYQVNDTRSGLERRVTVEEKGTFRAATSPDDTASTELGTAWTALYGVPPDPSTAWKSCITAVEALLAPIVSPNDTKPTLGKSIPELEGERGKRFLFRLASSSNQLDGVSTLAAMLRLMVNNPDRHGGGTRRVPTVEEATNVVQLAVTIVGWLRSGALTRVAEPIQP